MAPLVGLPLSPLPPPPHTHTLVLCVLVEAVAQSWHGLFHLSIQLWVLHHGLARTASVLAHAGRCLSLAQPGQPSVPAV